MLAYREWYVSRTNQIAALGYVSRTNQIAALGYVSRTNQSVVLFFGLRGVQILTT